MRLIVTFSGVAMIRFVRVVWGARERRERIATRRASWILRGPLSRGLGPEATRSGFPQIKNFAAVVKGEAAGRERHKGNASNDTNLLGMRGQS